LFKVSSAGGTPEPLTTLDQKGTEVAHAWPQVVAGGQAVLFSSRTTSISTTSYEDADIVVYSLATRQRKTVHRGGLYPRYVPSGHLVYVSEGSLFAAPFDLQRLEVTGPAAPILEGLVASPGYGGAQFSFSETGNLAYVASASGGRNLSVYWMNREGQLAPLREAPAEYLVPVFSPDGGRLALQITDGKRSDIWVYHWERDGATRLTFAGEDNRYPVWTPDGERITFATREKDGSFSLSWIRADGGGDLQRLTHNTNLRVPTSWRSDGKFLAFHEYTPARRTDIMTLPMDGSEKSGWKPGEPKPFLTSPANDWRPAFSPDGRWLAYTSGESGKNEVYVQPFPGPGGKWQISSGGGQVPTWSPNRKELLYRNRSSIMVVSYTTFGNHFRPGKPQVWSPGQLADYLIGRTYDLHPDGQRLAVLLPPAGKEARVDKVTLVFNFFDELRRKVPANRQ
jgi:serine/threonine-protein kinase